MASDRLHPVLLDDGAQLFLGTQKAAQDRSLLGRHRVSRVICVGTPAFHHGGSKDDDERNMTRSITYLEVDVLDLPSENLLGRLERCVSFIEEGMSQGENVLVNCVYAQSRSPTVVVAYLMKRKGVSLVHAIEIVTRAQPSVHINPGFEAQLDLYNHLGCRLPVTKRVEIGPTVPLAGRAELEEAEGKGPVSKPTTQVARWAAATYRWFLFACCVSGTVRGCTGSGGDVDTGEFQEDGMGHQYRCKACRAPLFRDSNVLEHWHPVVQAMSDSVFASFSRHGDGSSWLKARDAAATASAARSSSKAVRGARGPQHLVVRHGGDVAHCTSVFTEALNWVGITDRGVAQSSGKIYCPGKKGTGGICGSKLGAWSLDGIKCSCGRMVKPAIQFTLSRIERVQAFTTII